MKLLKIALLATLAPISLAQNCGLLGERAQECGASSSNRPAECCPGLVCAAGVSPLCVEPFPTASPTPPPPTCGVLGERSQQCGATDSTRPEVCCEGLVCAAGVSPLCVEPFPTASPTLSPPTCGVLGERSQECGAEDPTRPTECCEGLVCELGASPRCVEPFPTASPTLSCGVLGERSQQCGATDPTRPTECCEGLVCAAGASPLCVEPFPTASPTLSPPTCGVLGERSQQCGATDPTRPSFCCEGLVCAAGVSPLCVEPFPTASPTLSPPTCGVLGERSQECGADDPTRPAECCEGLVCELGASPRCVEPFPTATPTLWCADNEERAQECGAGSANRPEVCCAGLKCAIGISVLCVNSTNPLYPPPTPVVTPVPTTAAPTTKAPTASPDFVPAPAPGAGSSAAPVRGVYAALAAATVFALPILL